MPPRLHDPMPDLSGYEQWWQEHVRQPVTGDRDWFRIEAAKGDKTRKAEVWIYDRIGRSLWDEGTDAKSFARRLSGLDVDEITLHINSPGGDAFDGIAIFNSLRDHRATVNVVVDGLAASAASFIAQAGDTIRMNKAAQLMIHRASGVAIGNSNDMADFAAVLGKLDSSIAGIYTSRAGGVLDDWLTAMSAETWYTAAEAVSAGLADETVDEQPAEPKARASFDLRVFNYAGRDKAPPPPPRPSTAAPEPTPPGPTSAGGSANHQKGAGMDPARLAKLREAYDLPADAPEADVRAAMAADVTPPTPDPAPPTPPAPPGPEPDPALPPKQPAPSAGSDAVLMDPAHLRQLQAQAARGDEAFRKMREAECDKVISQAIKDGKFPPSREEHYRLRWATDPDGTEDEIKRLAKNTIPVSASGYTGVGDETETDMVYNAMYPDSTKAGASRG